MDLKDKIVLITGSSSGIGQTTALRFAKEGCKVIVNYHLNEAGASETVDEIKKFGGEAVAIKADVSKPEEIKELFSQIEKQFGTLDILINNAAIGTDKVDYGSASYDDILEMVNTDLISALVCTQYALKFMEKQGYGKILNTSSIRGIEYAGRAIVYAACKAGINSFTKTLAKRVAPKIQVNAVAPGFVRTRSYDKMTETQVQGFLDQTFLKRWVTKEEIADAFVFLAKNDAMTGHVLPVDAGFLLK